MTSNRTFFRLMLAASLTAASLGSSFSPVAAAPAAALDSSPLILINGKPLQLEDVTPVVRKGRLLVPMRAIFEALSAEVTYNGPLNTITAKRGDEILTLRPGINAAVLNGSLVQLDQAPIIIAGRVLVPLRFAGTALGADVTWDRARNLVLIVADPVEIPTPTPAPSPTPTATPLPLPPVTDPPGQLPPPTGPLVPTIPDTAPPVLPPSNPIGIQPPLLPPINLEPQIPLQPPVFQDPFPAQSFPVQPLPVTPYPNYPPIIVIPGGGGPIPNNPRPNPQPQPRFSVDSVSVEGPRVLGVGDTLRVEIRGTEGARAQISFGPTIGYLRLREERQSDGRYTGTYTVKQGDNGLNIRPIGALERGNNRDERRANQSFTFDTTAPRLISSPIKRGDVLASLPDRLTFRYEDLDPQGIVRVDAFLTTDRGREILTTRILNDNNVEVRLSNRPNYTGPFVLELLAMDQARNQSRDSIDFRLRDGGNNPGPGPIVDPKPRLELEIVGVDNPTNQWLREGQFFTLRANATPGARLRYSMGDAAHSGDMVENPPNSGRYEARYVVRAGDSASRPTVQIQAEANRLTVTKQAQLSINVDTVAPVLAMASPRAGSTLTEPVSEFVVQFDETGGSGLAGIQAVLTRGNNPISLNPEINGNRARFSVGPRIRPLLVGPVELRVSATDTAGNVRQAAFSFVFNTNNGGGGNNGGGNNGGGNNGGGNNGGGNNGGGNNGGGNNGGGGNNPTPQPFVRITGPTGTNRTPFKASGVALPNTQVTVTAVTSAPARFAGQQMGQFTLRTDGNGNWQTGDVNVPFLLRRDIKGIDIIAQVDNAPPARVTVQINN